MTATRPTAGEPGARRIVFALMSTVTALVLLFGYRTSSPHVTTSPTGASDATAGGGSLGNVAGDRYTGRAAVTRWGPVQVEITVADGRITGARAIQVPSGNARDAAINSWAVPLLDSEVLDAQSADIDTVSGATITSEGYQTSLQSALDAAAL